MMMMMSPSLSAYSVSHSTFVSCCTFIKPFAHLYLSFFFQNKCTLPATNQKDTKPNPAPPKKTAEKEPKRAAAQPAFAPSHIMLPVNIGANPANAAPQSLTTLTPRPVIVNNQVILQILSQ